MRRTQAVLNALLATAIVGILAIWAVAAFSGGAENPLDWSLAMITLYVLMAAGCLAIVLIGHAIATRTVGHMRSTILLMGLAVALLSFTRPVTSRLSGRDIVHLLVRNDTPEPIEWVDIFGRGAHVRIDRVMAAATVSVRYGGREIDYRTGDPFSNRLTVSWQAGGRARERVVVHEWAVIGDSLALTFVTSDSVVAGQPSAGVRRP